MHAVQAEPASHLPRCLVKSHALYVQVFDFPSVLALTTFIRSKLPADSAAPSPAVLPLAAIPMQPVAQQSAVPPTAMVAITSMSHRLPGPQRQMQLLSAPDTVSRIPYSRWDVWRASAQAHELQAGFGSFVTDAAGFDAAAFSLPEAEATLLDPQQRLLMQLAAEALGSAVSASDTRDLSAARKLTSGAGVFVGVSARDYFTLGKMYGEVRVVVHHGDFISQ